MANCLSYRSIQVKFSCYVQVKCIQCIIFRHSSLMSSLKSFVIRILAGFSYGHARFLNITAGEIVKFKLFMFISNYIVSKKR